MHSLKVIIINYYYLKCLVWFWVVWTLTRGHRWTWEAGVTGCCHPNPFHGSVTPVWPRCAHSSSSPAVPPFHSRPNVLHLLPATISCLVSSTRARTSRLSRSADPSPRLGSEELTLPHALEVLPPPQIKTSPAGWSNTYRGPVSPKHAGQRESVGLDLCHVETSYGFHVPLWGL